MKINRRFSRDWSLKSPRFSVVGGVAAVVAATFFILPGIMRAADTGESSTKTLSPSVDTNAPVAVTSTNTVQSADVNKVAEPAQKVVVKEQKPLSGAELYAVNCNRCHPERDPSEFTASQWDTMMIYMRVRANLPASHARAITKYLQDQAGQ